MADRPYPVLPEWSKMDNLGGLVPSEIRQALREYVDADRRAAPAPGGEDRKDAERWRVLVAACGETPLRPAAFGNEIMPDTRLKIAFPTIVSLDAVGNVTTLADWADAAIADAERAKP